MDEKLENIIKFGCVSLKQVAWKENGKCNKLMNLCILYTGRKKKQTYSDISFCSFSKFGYFVLVVV